VAPPFLLFVRVNAEDKTLNYRAELTFFNQNDITLTAGFE
jgi:hypothetical protein